MRKLPAILGSALFFVIAPGTIAGIVPWLISRWTINPPFFGLAPSHAAGVALIALGLVPLVELVPPLCRRGIGNAGAGVAAAAADRQRILPLRPQSDVCRRRVDRLGQSLLFANTTLLAYAAVVWLAFHSFVLGYEEPALTRQFGAAYDEFRKNVPRWMPRLTPWSGVA